MLMLHAAGTAYFGSCWHIQLVDLAQFCLHPQCHRQLLRVHQGPIVKVECAIHAKCTSASDMSACSACSSTDCSATENSCHASATRNPSGKGIMHLMCCKFAVSMLLMLQVVGQCSSSESWWQRAAFCQLSWILNTVQFSPIWETSGSCCGLLQNVRPSSAFASIRAVLPCIEILVVADISQGSLSFALLAEHLRYKLVAIAFCLSLTLSAYMPACMGP